MPARHHAGEVIDTSGRKLIVCGICSEWPGGQQQGLPGNSAQMVHELIHSLNLDCHILDGVVWDPHPRIAHVARPLVFWDLPHHIIINPAPACFKPPFCMLFGALRKAET